VVAGNEWKVSQMSICSEKKEELKDKFEVSYRYIDGCELTDPSGPT
jgi:hypothetical protein